MISPTLSVVWEEWALPIHVYAYAMAERLRAAAEPVICLGCGVTTRRSSDRRMIVSMELLQEQWKLYGQETTDHGRREAPKNKNSFQTQ